MGVFANGYLMYGFVCNNEHEELFAEIKYKWQETNEDDYSLEEMFTE
jgi:hypothetical protein